MLGAKCYVLCTMCLCAKWYVLSAMYYVLSAMCYVLHIKNGGAISSPRGVYITPTSPLHHGVFFYTE